MTFPNFITIGRCFLVPVMIWALVNDRPLMAFFVFLGAGLSDALDGIAARMMNQRSALGAVLDPLADKLMLVSGFAAIAWLGHIPVWIAVLVIGRDVLLLAGIALAIMLGRKVVIEPLPVSKVTTVFQIALVATVLGSSAFAYPLPTIVGVLEWLVVAFTVLSASAYGIQGVRTLFGIGTTNLAAGREI